jgi:hypothetical protein
MPRKKLAISNNRFNELLNGPLAGPAIEFSLLRVVQALRYVVEGLGAPAVKILEDYCEAREEQDKGNAAFDPDDEDSF